MKQENNRISLLNEFAQAPTETLFDEKTVAAVRLCTRATLQRDRWASQGIPFIKIGSSVRYKKNDVITWLDKHIAVNSTSEADQQRDNANV